MQKLSVTQVSELLGRSARHIRNLCKEGKLPCQKMKISTGEKYLIYTDTEEFQELLSTKEVQGEVEENTPLEGTVSGSEEGSVIEDGSSWQELISGMTSRIESLAKEAGKAELLVDTLMTSEQNVKFYQDEYFKIRHDLENTRHELAEVKEENLKMKAKVSELEKELENRSKPFWARK